MVGHNFLEARELTSGDIFPIDRVSNIMAVLLALVTVVALPRAPWNIKLLCFFLAIGTIVIAQVYDKWGAI